MNFLRSIESKVTGLWTNPKPEDIGQLNVVNPDGADHKDNKEDYSKEERSSLWKSLSGKLGMDVTVGVSLPVWLCEPTTVLTRQAEMLHFTNLLNEAANCESSVDRLAYVALFAISAYNGTERFGKPFNPILGETFEYVDKETDCRLFAEQVSHHPPISACHAESPNFVFYQESRPKSKFLGNSVELDTQGKTHIYFPKSRDHILYHVLPTTHVNNLIVGRMWIEHSGPMVLKNLKTGDTCTLQFEKCGWLGKGRNEVSGYVKDASGKDALFISGKWSESINIKWLYEGGKEPKDTTIVGWKRPTNNAIGKYKATEFALKLNEFDAEYEKLLPPTDSRLRPDRKALENADVGEAAIMKQKMEEKQRHDKKNRVAKGEEWKPRWFKQIPEETGPASESSDSASSTGSSIWVYCGDYWEQREKKLQLLQQDTVKDCAAKAEASVVKKEDQDESALPAENEQDLLMAGPSIRGLACDFRSY